SFPHHPPATINPGRSTPSPSPGATWGSASAYRQARHNGAVHSRCQRHDPGRNEPTRPARSIDRREAATRGLAGGGAPPEAGGRRRLPSPWSRLASGQCRASEPGSGPGNVGDRAVPLGRARRACRALRGLRPQPHRLQLVPQSPPAFAGAGYCPKCQGAAAQDWLAAREADLLPVGYFHVVFTLPAEISPIAYQNKVVVYDLLFRTAAETLLTIAADPKHLGARIGATAVLHSWGSTMTHHPHIHMIVPGGGISLDGTRWVRCKPGFLLPVQVLSRLFRRLFLAALVDAHAAGRLAFFGKIQDLHCRETFAARLAPLKRKRWFVYTKPPFAGPEAVLAYLARYTHRVAISNSRLIALAGRGVTFRYKDYRRKGPARYCTITLSADEFIRRFLLHVLPKGFHRIRHYGLLASAGCKANIARAK